MIQGLQQKLQRISHHVHTPFFNHGHGADAIVADDVIRHRPVPRFQASVGGGGTRENMRHSLKGDEIMFEKKTFPISLKTKHKRLFF